MLEKPFHISVVDRKQIITVSLVAFEFRLRALRKDLLTIGAEDLLPAVHSIHAGD